MNPSESAHRTILQRIAHQAMLERGLLPDFAPAVLAEVARIDGAATDGGATVHDLRELLWCSIDNDDSRDLDQLTVAEALAGEAVKVVVRNHAKLAYDSVAAWLRQDVETGRMLPPFTFCN